MKLLRIKARGLALFREELDICFYAQQRVSEDDRESLINLFSNIYLNPAVGLIGINASGKTSVLRVISLVCDILNSNPINHSAEKAILKNSEEVEIDSYYMTNSGDICKLRTVIVSSKDLQDEKYIIKEETLWAKHQSDVLTRKSLTDFDGLLPLNIRDTTDTYLPDDVSITIAQNRKNRDSLNTISLLQYTDLNFLPFAGNVPPYVITFLDPTIEYLNIEAEKNNKIVHLKFKGQDEIVLNNTMELNGYLSSGTIKGIVTFIFALGIITNGGMLIIDEIENHFNKEIVLTLMRLFMDTETNKKGGTLVFSTHYPEILDEYDRNDSIYVTRNNNGITAENLNNILKRNDIKKSEAYKSGFLNGTTPSYEAYMNLKRNIAENIVKVEPYVSE